MPFDQRLCHLCNRDLEVAFTEVRDPQTGDFFGILRCPECGLGHTTPQPDDVGQYYGPMYHRGRHGFTEHLCVRRRLRFVRAITCPRRVLDFGCGDGGFTAAAATAGWHALGVETQPEHARSKGLTVVDRIEDTTGPFDVITLWHSLEHVHSPRAVMAALSERLAPGGFLFVAVPNGESVQARVFGASWFHLDVPRHLFHFTPLALNRLLASCSLRVVRRWDLEMELDLFGWTQSTLNRIIQTPNVLFDVLTRRPRRHRPFEIGASVLLGAAATATAAPVVLLTAALSRGAVMIVAAEKQDAPQ